MERFYAGTPPLKSQDAAVPSVKVNEDLPTCVVRTKNDQIVLDALTKPVINAKGVELRNFNLDELNAQHLDSLFGGCSQECQSLSLEKCTLSGDRFSAMMTERLTRNRIKLLHFRVKRCQQVSMTSLIAMSTLFTSSLVTLELSSCKLPRQAGIILSQSLQVCTSLRHLLLADNNIRDGGLRAIADALKLLHASSGSAVGMVLGQEDNMPPSILEQFDISRNGITSAGFASLTQLPLRHLSATGNAIDGGVGSLLINNAMTLETLCLLGNPLSEDGKLDLVRALFRRRDKGGKSVLREVDLRACGFNSPDSLDLLQRSFLQAATAGQQCSLQTLYLDELHMDEEIDCTNFKKGCEGLKEVAKANFPGLRLRFQSDVHMENLPNPMQASSQLRGVSSLRKTTGSEQPAQAKTVTFAKTLVGLDTELEALAMATKTSVNATLASVAGLPSSPLSGQHQVQSAECTRPDESVTLHYIAPDLPRGSSPITTAVVQAQPLQSITSSSAMPIAPLPMQHIDVEYIVSKTIECMSHNFEIRLGQFLSRMETQQQDRSSSKVQFLAAKVEAYERALPRLEARLDMLTDRVAAGSAQLAKLQNDVALQFQQVRQEALTQHISNQYSNPGGFNSTQLSATMSLSSRMQAQVEALVASRVQVSEQGMYSEMDRVRAQANSTPTDPHAVVNAVSAHLTQFKREFDANQAGVLSQFTESMNCDGRRLEERIAHVEDQIGSLESVIQSEQQASLLALEAISDAFNDPAAPVSTRKM